MTRMPRELDPEWFWRARLWAAAWKVPILVGIGVMYGTVWVYFQLGTMTIVTRAFSFLIGVVIIGWIVLVLRHHFER